MECPRCGGVLTTFTLGDATATVCEACEYVGVPVDHRPEPEQEPESWADAFDRFHRKTSSGDQRENNNEEAEREARSDRS